MDCDETLDENEKSNVFMKCKACRMYIYMYIYAYLTNEYQYNIIWTR